MAQCPITWAGGNSARSQQDRRRFKNPHYGPERGVIS
ncbi:hypothetical protein Laurelin_BL50054 [Xanthomonas phage Laurelin]|nr:hypothetical protein Laurelin_BL50054 [Xanthomonas phage Laurelin]